VEMTTHKGTQSYMAPEIYSSKSYGPEGLDNTVPVLVFFYGSNFLLYSGRVQLWNDDVGDF